MSQRDSELRPAYVLHARPYRESSMLLELLVLGKGRIGVIARGVRGARSTARRALLQPLQPLHVGVLQRGELGLLTQCEAASQPLRVRGDALLAVLYVNELCQRLLPRDEPADDFFLRYAACLATLADGGAVGPALRRLESSLLAEIGYALDVGSDSAGAPIEADARYWIEASGALQRSAPGSRPSVSGAALIALADDAPLPVDDAVALRRLLRERLRQLLGTRPLRCWGLLDELSGLAGGGVPQGSSATPMSASQADSKA